MKFVFIILLIVSCGKKSIPEEAYQIDQTTMSQDSDGDGVQDWDEIHAGTDPYIAQATETFPEIGNEVTLVQNDGLEVVVQPQFKRVLRDLLLKKTFQSNKDLLLPEISQLELRFQNRPAYWRTKLAGKHFTKILSIAGKSLKLENGFIDEPSLKLNANLSNGDINELKERTYRFIISTPEVEKIYRVSTKLGIRDFMIQQKIFPANQSLDELDRDSYGWRSVNLNKDFSNTPMAGKTYAVVYAASSEFRAAELSSTKISLINGIANNFTFSQKLNVTIFMTHAQVAITKDKTKEYDLSPNPHLPARCNYTTRTLVKREKQVLQSIESANELINWDASQIAKLDWFESGLLGVAFNLTILTSDDEWNPRFKSDLLNSTIVTGVIKSGCERTIPVKKRLLPRITGLDGYLLLEPSL